MRRDGENSCSGLEIFLCLARGAVLAEEEEEVARLLQEEEEEVSAEAQSKGGVAQSCRVLTTPLLSC